MNHEEARIRIQEILNTQILFEGHFNKCFNNLKETQKQDLLEWIEMCKNKEINPIQSKINREIIGFVRRIGSNLRVILTKKKEEYFITLFLDKHKYYEVEMNKLGF